MKPQWGQIRTEIFNRYIRDKELPVECQSDPYAAPDAAAHEAIIAFLAEASEATDSALARLQDEWCKAGVIKCWEAFHHNRRDS